jgi:hypothetical protein
MASTPYRAPAQKIISVSLTACVRAVSLILACHFLEEPFTSAYRWHLPDPVPFRKSLRFSIEQGNGTPPFKSHNDYYSVAYWYQTEPHAQFPKLASGEEGVGWATERQTTK